MNTVGSALRRVQDEVTRDMERGATALVLVPDDDAPAWSKLLRHDAPVKKIAMSAAL